MVYTSHVLLFSSKKEWSIYIYYNVNESQKCYAKWKKPETEGNVIYDSIYMKYPE